MQERHFSLGCRSLAVLWIFCLVPACMIAQQPAHDRQDDLTSLLFKTKSGLTLNYVEQGDPGGPVLVLLHGAGDSWHSYGTPALPDGAPCVRREGFTTELLRFVEQH